MAHVSDLIAEDIEAYLKSHEHKSLLRFITCGSVDDGKSTLIGRLLYDSKMIFEDQLAALEADSKKVGTQGGELDFALLVDGLAAEREQGITIDVAYRYLLRRTKRKFIVADTPGHEQYTRNMVTGASTADLAVILIDARKGVLTQTRRHSYIVSLLGIKHVVLAINKMDLVDYSREVFDTIVQDYREFAGQINLHNIVAIPVSGLRGDNITEQEPAHAVVSRHDADWAISRPSRSRTRSATRRSACRCSGSIAPTSISAVSPARSSAAHPSGREGSRAALGPREQGRAARDDGWRPRRRGGRPVHHADARGRDRREPRRRVREDGVLPSVADQFEATVIWMADEPMLPGRPYWIKIGAKQVSATITGAEVQDQRQHARAPGRQDARTQRDRHLQPVARPVDRVRSYNENRDTGAFILIDRLTNATIGAGLLHFALRRSQNIHWQALEVNKTARANIKGQQPTVLWFTGLSGAGKSTIANLVEKQLLALGRHTYLLDGDNVRHGLNRDLGFTDADRVENIRRVGEVAKLMADAGLVVMVSFISPFRAERRMARSLFAEGEFYEVHVDTPLVEAEKRDVKGLYKKARRGELKNFTGIDSPYEPPENPEIYVDTTQSKAEEAAAAIIEHLRRYGRLGAG